MALDLERIGEDQIWNRYEEELNALEMVDDAVEDFDADLVKLRAFVDDQLEGLWKYGWDYTIYDEEVDGHFVVVFSNYSAFNREFLMKMVGLAGTLRASWLIKIEVMDAIRDGIMYHPDHRGIFLIAKEKVVAWLTPDLEEKVVR